MKPTWTAHELRAHFRRLVPSISDAEYEVLTTNMVDMGVLEVVGDGYSPSKIGVYVLSLGAGRGH